MHNNLLFYNEFLSLTVFLAMEMHQQLYLHFMRQRKAEVLAPDSLVAVQSSKFTASGILG